MNRYDPTTSRTYFEVHDMTDVFEGGTKKSGAVNSQGPAAPWGNFGMVV
jgi:hypothetical protein